jgi:hypothetical protein
MAYTHEMASCHKGYRELFELSIEEAASELHSGLWDSDQVTIEQIQVALIGAVASGELKPKRGSVGSIGKFNSNPAILEAHEIVVWAERHGLELESNGGWAGYIEGELEIQDALEERLEALRALQSVKKERAELLSSQDDPERKEDRLISLQVENSKLRGELAEIQGANGKASSPRENPKSLHSLLRMVFAMAVDGYGFDPKVGKSPVPKQIADAIMEKLGESIEPDTTRAWLQEGAKQFPLKN